MNSVLCFTLRFLDAVPRFHGRGSDGEPEWPPSPLRMFQALVCAAATRWRENQFRDYARPALQWLEAIQPGVVTPSVPSESYGFRMYVPNNSGDLMTAAWARGDTDTSMAKYRVEKDVRPTHLQSEAVHYLYPLPTGDCPHFEVLSAAARSITHLGWGVDLVAGNATLLSQEEADELAGHRWQVVPTGGTPLRVPKPGTIDDLMRKHAAFLNRLGPDGFKPVPPLSCFDVVGYHSPTVASDKPHVPFHVAAFSLLRPDAEGRRAFTTTTRTKDVAGMLRNLVADQAERLGLSDDEVRTMVHGHADENTPLRGELADRRLMYLPVPTINPALNRVEAIRRVVIAGPIQQRKLIDDIQRRLSGEFLQHQGQPQAMLTVLPRSDWVVKQYLGAATGWSTVTPVVLPGHHKGDTDRASELLLDAFHHAHLPPVAEWDWRPVGFRAGAELASRYLRPDHMNGSLFHVRVRFAQEVQGPLVVGAGRYRGFGLFAIDV